MTQFDSNQQRRDVYAAVFIQKYSKLQNLTKKDKITKLNTITNSLTLRLPRFLISLLGVNEEHSFLRGSPERCTGIKTSGNIPIFSNSI